MNFLYQLFFRYFTVNLDRLIPTAQQVDPTFLEQLSSSFREGSNPVSVYVGIIILVGALIGAYFLLRILSSFGSQQTERKQYDILESIQSNLKLNEKQDRYLKALIEKFKNRASYEPEVSTDYLEDFLFFAVQNLTYAPKRSIRRKTHYLPDFEINDSIDLMFKVDQDTYTTLQSEILKQEDDTVTIKRPFGDHAKELKENQAVDVAYQNGELTLRGEAEIESIDEQEVQLDFSEGMHFEEQRTYDRVPVNRKKCQLILQEWEGNTIRLEAYIVNLSIGGAKLEMEETDKRIHRNMRGRMQFQLNAKEIDLEIVVIHKEEDQDPPTLGIEFLEPGMRNRNLLHEYVSNEKSEEDNG